MKVLIIEDEPLAVEKISLTLKEVKPDVEIVGTTHSVDESIEWLNSNEEPDLILSDIHLADGLCFSIYSNVDISCPIIFTTAYEKYAIQAFEVNSVDYLLKPVQKDRLLQALNKYENLRQVDHGQRVDMFEEFKTILSRATKEYKSRFLCKLGNKIKSVPVSHIMYFYSKDKMTFIVDKDKARLPINNTLDELDQMVDPKDFFRVNRQYIAHFDAISEIHPYFKGRLKIKLEPETEDDIIVSTDKSPLFKAWLDR